MFSFKKDETTKLIELSVQDHKAWEAAKARLEKAKSAWQTLQAEIELLCARSASFSGTASHDMHEPWWRARDSQLAAQIVAKSGERDSLVMAAAAAVEATKRVVFRRNATITEAAKGWCTAVAGRLPEGDPLRIRLEAACHQLDDLTLGSMSEIVNMIIPLVNTVESDENLDAPVFKFARAVSQALSIGSEVTENSPAAI